MKVLMFVCAPAIRADCSRPAQSEMSWFQPEALLVWEYSGYIWRNKVTGPGARDSEGFDYRMKEIEMVWATFSGE